MSTKNRKHRRNISCWLKWDISPEGDCSVQLWYWGALIHTVSVPKDGNKAENWWNTQERAHNWARRKGFLFIKEWLHK